MENSDLDPLMPGADTNRSWWRKHNLLCGLLVTLGIVAFGVAVGLGVYSNIWHEPINLKVMSLNCWGVPHTLGAQDKEARMLEIAKMIGKKEYDVYLLEELWMRPDHETIRTNINKTNPGWFMTEIYELGPYGTCDGRVLPKGCSGLAIVSRFPFVETEFNVFSVNGDFWWGDGEYFARKGVGRVRIEPKENVTVDIFVTHTAASDYNFWYREIQTQEVVHHVKNSSADFAVLGGDFNVDPRMNETSYHTLAQNLRSAMMDFFKYLEELLQPSRATYANPVNTYSYNFSEGPQLYDHFFYHTRGWDTIVTNIFHIPFLKAKIFFASENDSEVDRANGREVSLSDHEAITADLLLFKSRF